MTSISLIVNGVTVVASANGKITSGMVGLPVYIQYDESWNDLEKTAYFRVGKLVRKRDPIGTATTVPWELLRNHGIPLQIGIEGRNESGDIVVPTIWATVDTICEGASGGVPAAPSPERGDEPTGGGAVIDDSIVSPGATWSSQKIADEIDGRALIDDPAVGKNAWSSKNIVDRLCPAFSESGAAVTCTPVAGYPLGVVSGITPIQAGSGDPSPTNVRPLTGYTQAKLRHGGKNLFSIDLFTTRDTVVNNGDGSITVTGNGVGTGSQNILRKLAPELEAGKTYVLSAESTGDKKYIHMIGPRISWNFGSALTLTDAILDSQIYWYSNTDKTIPATIRNIQIEPGTVATEYEPYREATQYVAELGQEVYAGTYDWSTGLLTLTHKMVTFTGEEAGWVDYSDTIIVNYNYIKDAASAYEFRGWSSHTPDKSAAFRIINASGGIRVAQLTTFWGLAENTAATWIAYLKEQAAAGTPVQVLYELETPTTVQLAPQEIFAISGANTLYSDTGDTAVTGRIDPVTKFGQMEARIAALEAAISNT